MTPNNPAPRPCTLWEVQYNNVKYAEIVDYGTLDNTCWGIVVHTDTRSYDTNRETSYKKLAESWLIEAINAIYQANHPPLCMKHALEIRYEFVEGGLYSFKKKGVMPTYGKFVGLTDHRTPFLLYSDYAGSQRHFMNDGRVSFYPCDEYGHPTHGEAEAVVNVWEGGE